MAKRAASTACQANENHAGGHASTQNTLNARELTTVSHLPTFCCLWPGKNAIEVLNALQAQRVVARQNGVGQ